MTLIGALTCFFIALPSLQAEENKKSPEYEVSGIAPRIRFINAINAQIISNVIEIAAN